MELYEALNKRVASRSFDPIRQVPKETILKILAMGATAPSGENYQPWEFILIRDNKTREMLAKIKLESRKRVLKTWYPELSDEEIWERVKPQEVAMKTASWFVAVCYKNLDTFAEVGNMRISLSLAYVYGCINYIWLAATAEGVGVSPTVYPYDIYEEAKRILRLPEGFELALILRMGYPIKKPKSKKTSVVDIEKKIHYEFF
jgi:nitroreductase